jgi:hypothetical protein
VRARLCRARHQRVGSLLLWSKLRDLGVELVRDNVETRCPREKPRATLPRGDALCSRAIIVREEPEIGSR